MVLLAACCEQVWAAALRWVRSCASQTTMCGCCGATVQSATPWLSSTPSSAITSPSLRSSVTMRAGHRSSASRSPCSVRAVVRLRAHCLVVRSLTHNDVTCGQAMMLHAHWSTPRTMRWLVITVAMVSWSATRTRTCKLCCAVHRMLPVMARPCVSTLSSVAVTSARALSACKPSRGSPLTSDRLDA